MSCPITSTDAQGATCAQLFLNRSNVPVVTEGELLTGESSFIGTMNGQKPVISIFTHGKGADPNTFYLDGAIQGQLASVTYLANIVHAKNVSIIGPDIPGVAADSCDVQGPVRGPGRELDGRHLPERGHRHHRGDRSLGCVERRRAVRRRLDSDECIALAKAFKQLGLNSKPVVSLPECLEPAVKQALGDYPKWTYVYTGKNPAAPYTKNGQMAAYIAAMNVLQQPGQRAGRILPADLRDDPDARQVDESAGPDATSTRPRSRRRRRRSPARCTSATRSWSSASSRSRRSARSGRSSTPTKGNNQYNEVSNGQWICPPVTASGCPS